MKKMIKIESGSFAALVRSYKKSLNMLAVLQHICQENDRSEEHTSELQSPS